MAAESHPDSWWWMVSVTLQREAGDGLMVLSHFCPFFSTSSHA